jgi:hypothetical protein
MRSCDNALDDFETLVSMDARIVCFCVLTTYGRANSIVLECIRNSVTLHSIKDVLLI